MTKTNWMIESRKVAYQAMAHKDFPADHTVACLPILDQLIPLFGYGSLSNDCQALTRVRSYIWEKLRVAFAELKPSEFHARGVGGSQGDELWIMPRSIEPAVRSYVEYVIRQRIESGQWDKLLDNAAKRCEVAFG